MWKNTLILSLLFLAGVQAYAGVPDSLRLRYEAAPRDIAAVRDYVEALEGAGRKKEAEKVVRTYMDRCPVAQITDKDTYLLCGPYLFGDPYSNAFEYALYAMKKMRWEREEEVPEGKSRLKNLQKAWGWDSFGKEDTDKRYEVMSVLDRNLNREVERLCEPLLQGRDYRMPDWDEGKMARLEQLARKSGLPGRDRVRLLLYIRRELHEGRYGEVMESLCSSLRMDICGVRGGYAVGIFDILLEKEWRPERLEAAVRLVEGLVKEEEAEGGGCNYYFVLSELEEKLGHGEEAGRYRAMGERTEAEKEAFFRELMGGRAD